MRECVVLWWTFIFQYSLRLSYSWKPTIMDFGHELICALYMVALIQPKNYQIVCSRVRACTHIIGAQCRVWFGPNFISRFARAMSKKDTTSPASLCGTLSRACWKVRATKLFFRCRKLRIRAYICSNLKTLRQRCFVWLKLILFWHTKRVS